MIIRSQLIPSVGLALLGGEIETCLMLDLIVWIQQVVPEVIAAISGEGGLSPTSMKSKVIFCCWYAAAYLLNTCYNGLIAAY